MHLIVKLNKVNVPSGSSRRRRALRHIAGWLLWLAALIALFAVLQGQAALLSGAACLFGLGCVLWDGSRLDHGGLEPVTLFALSLSIGCFANAIGFVSIASMGATSPYALYADERFFFLASALAAMGGLATIIGYKYVSSFGGLPVVTAPLPTIRGRIQSPFIVPTAIAIAALGMTLRVMPAQHDLGAIGSLLKFAPNLVVFALARYGFSQRRRRLINVALGIALAEATRAALFDYLRSGIVVPLFAFTLAAVIGTRTVRILGTRYFMPIYAIVIGFAAYFAAMGQVRLSGATGTERVAAVFETQDQAANDSESDHGLMVRLTTLNQLSQIGRLTQQSGYLRGQTLTYLAFAFIPRVIWPDKPTIAKGQWFAFRIGQAIEKPDGTYSSAVNMTVPGELYLNFGWIGVALGCFGLGALFAVLWSRTAFWTESRNVLGSALGFYLLWTAFGAGADLQIVVTLIAMYLLFVVANACGIPFRRSQRLRATQLHTVRVKRIPQS